MGLVGSTYLSLDGVEDLIVYESHAFVLVSNQLRVYDISVPDTPMQVGVLENVDSFRISLAIDEAGEFVYLADLGSLRAYSVMDRQNPVFSGFVNFGGSDNQFPVRVAVRGANAYVVSGEGILRIVDISDPTAPELLSVTPTGPENSIYNMIVGDGYVLLNQRIAGREGSFFALDVSDPRTPFHIPDAAPIAISADAVIAGDLLITNDVYDGKGGVSLWDVSDLRSPIRRAGLPPCSGIATDGNRVLLANCSPDGIIETALTAFDISNPDDPDFLGTVANFGVRNLGGLGGERAVMYGGGDQFEDFVTVFDVSTQISAEGKTTELGAQSWGLVLDCAGDLDAVYVATEERGLLEVTDIETGCPEIHEIGQLPLGSGTPAMASLALTASALFVAGGAGLEIYGRRSTGELDAKTIVTLFGGIQDVSAYGASIALLDDIGRLHILSTDDPQAPEFRGSIMIDPAARSVALGASAAYVAAENAGMSVVDLGDPTKPEVVATVPTPARALDVTLIGTTAIVHDESSIVAIDVAVPASAAVVAALPLTFSPLGQEPARFASVTSIGNTVYAARIDGVHVFEVAMSGALQRLGSVAELTEGFTVVGDALAIANRSAFLVYPAHCPGTFSIPMSY
ncbi:MAG: hypothetical protein JRF15_00530 [Deltaproteobacteria bacterium]|jgi:hypothetical protein|nr:hypothetical protein [Deltaproteobacteria bacterium]